MKTNLQCLQGVHRRQSESFFVRTLGSFNVFVRAVARVFLKCTAMILRTQRRIKRSLKGVHRFFFVSSSLSPSQIAYIYTDIQSAKKEIASRWNNMGLRAEIAHYLNDVPPCFQNEPRAILFRNIISATNELGLFMKQANELNLKPIGLEYTHDRFSTQNFDKMTLVKMPMVHGRDKNGNAIVSHKIITDIKGNDNQCFCEIVTNDGQRLVDFHHDLVKRHNHTIETFDLSAWIKESGGVARAYYKKFFALLICHGVLFESFIGNKSESEFASEVIIPAYEHVQKRFGVTPLIVQNVPAPIDPYWYGYDA